jgi:hypothetical protein
MTKTNRRIVSGARVNFDPRTTAEADTSRDPRNYKSEEQPWREKRYWQRKAKGQKKA